MICDYEGSDYKIRFWQNADRAYEDAVERIALRRLLPPRGKRIVEFGAGFGRLADLYTGYDEIILLDYSRTLLEEAMERWGSDPRFLFVAADIYHLPFVGGIMDSATMVRVIHHIADVPAALTEIRRVMMQSGTFVLEFANKCNVKAMVRFLLRRQNWSPYSREPVEFAKLNYDFHPGWMRQQLQTAGFRSCRALTVSYLRLAALKRIMPAPLMIRADSALQFTAPLGWYSPSVFTQNAAIGTVGQPAAVAGKSIRGEAIFRSPATGGFLRREGDVLVCDTDGTRWNARGRFYDFKEPVTA